MTWIENCDVELRLQLTFRPATAEDLPRLEWYGQYRHFRRLFHRTYQEQLAGRRLMLIADLNQFPIGHIFIHFKTKPQPYAYLYSLRVMEMFRGQGVGSYLIARAESIIWERQMRQIMIAVAKTNHAALRLYERLGYKIFTEDAGDWSYIDDRGQRRDVHEPCWLLEKYLEAR